LTTAPRRLPRTLGLWSGVALVIGITIGSGIFRSPAGIARLVPSAPLVIGLWVAGGIITLCGALSLGELAAALPESGGFYAYLREAW
jgi:APA family basic amino acid/polyamine antiporter